jgi:hypothetical protein
MMTDKASGDRQEQLRPCKELIALCGGDINQAGWLLYQIKLKNPHKSLEWYNAQAIGQLEDPDD